MADETLVEALEKAGVGAYSADYRAMVARDADPIFKTLARFASPEVKRGVLAVLLGDRLEKMADPEGDLMVSGWREDGERGSVWVTVPFLRDLLAPLEAP